MGIASKRGGGKRNRTIVFDLVRWPGKVRKTRPLLRGAQVCRLGDRVNSAPTIPGNPTQLGGRGGGEANSGPCGMPPLRLKKANYAMLSRNIETRRDLDYRNDCR